MANTADSGLAGVVRRSRREESPGATAAPRRMFARRTKRCMDVSMALVMLVALAPLMILIALVVRLDSAGPVIFRQERVGQNGRRFRILKFRTMTNGAPDDHHRAYIAAMTADCHRPGGLYDRVAGLVSPFRDPNITRVGRWLRRISLDELPQLINVLRGEMSLVGPRPLPPYEIDWLADWALRRLTVPQGMTGLWQVSGRSALPYIRMLELDIDYVDNWSIWGDLRILLRTLRSIACDWDKTA